jgi:hypothetical protein
MIGRTPWRKARHAAAHHAGVSLTIVVMMSSAGWLALLVVTGFSSLAVSVGLLGLIYLLSRSD